MLHHKTNRTLLAGDIGATKTLFAIFSVSEDRVLKVREDRFITKDCGSFEEVIREFLHDEVPDVISFGVAGPVMDGVVNITNVATVLNSKQMSEALNHIPVYFINDLEATGYGISWLKDEELKLIFEGRKNATGNIGIIAPGTGLGEAAAYWDGHKYHQFSTEGCHCDFASRTQEDFELYNYLREKYTHVSWERVVSGNGIIQIFEFLQQKKKEIPEWLTTQLKNEDAAKVISSNAKKVEICGQTMQLFFRYLAQEAGQLALKTKATGGLFIGGGIMPQILSLLDIDAFMQQFTDFGRLKFLLEAIPVKVILNEQTALLGAAAFGAAVLGFSFDKTQIMT
jgi:glucokinase